MTRLSYNCAHLRWTKEYFRIISKKILVKIFLGENFWGENFWGENFFGLKTFGVTGVMAVTGVTGVAKTKDRAAQPFDHGRLR